jgi:triosephosphate isomerase
MMTVSAPFFEFGPKMFMNRESLLDVVETASASSVEHDVDVIVTPPALDLEAVKRRAPRLRVFAQSMDLARGAARVGAIVADALAAVGADGVLLNHAERPLDEATLRTAIEQARDAGLQTLVCANDVAEAARFAGWSPDMILLEPSDLIGTAHHRHRPWIGEGNRVVAAVNPLIEVMHSGGVADEADVLAIMRQGAAGTGCTSAIVRAPDPSATTERMIRAVREGWDAHAELTSTAPTPDGEVA